jgi:hypothetical protein
MRSIEGPGGFADSFEADVDQILAAASEQARAQVVEWLVPLLADSYRTTIERRLDRGDPEEKGQYVYAVLEVAASFEPMFGVTGAPVSVIADRHLAALTSEVPLAPFRALQQGRELTETGWTADAVRAHDEVISQVFANTPLLPMRFGTLYASVEDVLALLRGHDEQLTAELERLRGCAEWTCKLMTGAAAGRSAATRAATGSRQTVLGAEAAIEGGNVGAGDLVPSGTDWMREQQLVGRERATERDRAHQYAGQVHEALTGLARAVSVTKPPGTPSGEQILLQATYLVSEVEKFTGMVEDLASYCAPHGMRLVLSGPWAPYHFVELPAAEVNSHG